RDWQGSENFRDNDGARDEFIAAWKLGYLDASAGKNPAMDNLQSRPLAADGYETGYIAVLDHQGVIEYDCSEGDETDNEYRDRWCEASKAYNKSNLGSAANAVLRSNYINGYMAGRAIALTIPTSMESLFGDAALDENAKKPIDAPEADTPKGIQIFYKGFNDGFKAMIDTVRESVNQVMEQMQNMPGMEGMDGMPGMMPGMDGMPPDMPPGMDDMMPGMGDDNE
ncbi:MAG: myeloid leukemia factor, partial [Desulfovibrionales bacterium]|nr:myeloid leukemia factor [Desulfovibrionales bacterium]